MYPTPPPVPYKSEDWRDAFTGCGLDFDDSTMEIWKGGRLRQQGQLLTEGTTRGEKKSRQVQSHDDLKSKLLSKKLNGAKADHKKTRPPDSCLEDNISTQDRLPEWVERA